jgi:hypothetical protein
VRNTSSDAIWLRLAVIAISRTAFTAAAQWTAETAPKRSISSPSESRTFCFSSGTRPSDPALATSSRVVFEPTSITPILISMHGRSPIGEHVHAQMTIR